MSIEKHIEQTLLRPTASEADFLQLFEQCKKYNFYGVCVPPYWVKKAARELADYQTQIVTVIGFPLGYDRTESKLFQVQKAIEDGADELDMVINLSAYFSSAHHWVKSDIATLANYAHAKEKVLKVIIETAYLSAQDISFLAILAQDAGADFIKTSTGFAPKGAQVADIKHLRNILAPHVGIKASGGIQTKKHALDFLEAGADRIGTSNGEKIMLEI